MKKEKYFTERERLAIENIIRQKTGYCIRGNCLLLQTFTRSSYSAEHGGENNEILEFIGDQVLSYHVVRSFAKTFGALNGDYEYTFRVRENRFNDLKQSLINNETLAKIIDEWDITKYLIVGKSDFANGVDKQKKVKADLFEAIIGAIAIESEWNNDVLEKAISKMLSIEERIKVIIKTNERPPEFNIENSINALKEFAERGGCTPPQYEYGTPEQLGYDQDGNPVWVCTCTVIGEKTGHRRQVWTSSKKDAKKAASYLILCDIFDLQNEYGANGKYVGWKYKKGKIMPYHMMDEDEKN